MCNAAKQVVLDSDLPTAKKFLAYRVAELVNDHHEHDFWMAPESLAAETGLHVGTVRKYLGALVDLGMLVVIESGGGRARTTRYRFVGCEDMHKPRPQARNPQSETAPLIRETAPVVRETAPLIRETAPGGAPYIENKNTTTEEPKENTLLTDLPPASCTPKPVDEFDAWWALVPRRTSKGAARNAFKGARKKVDAATLTAGVQRWADETRDADPRFIPHPATWLNGERWLDDPIPAPKSVVEMFDELESGEMTL